MSPREQKKNRDALIEKMLRFAFWMRDLRVLPTPESVAERFAVSRSTAYRWLATARAIRGVHLP